MIKWDCYSVDEKWLGIGVGSTEKEAIDYYNYNFAHAEGDTKAASAKRKDRLI